MGIRIGLDEIHFDRKTIRIAGEIAWAFVQSAGSRVRQEILWWLASGDADSEARRYVEDLAHRGDFAARKAIDTADRP